MLRNTIDMTMVRESDIERQRLGTYNRDEINNFSKVRTSQTFGLRVSP